MTDCKKNGHDWVGRTTREMRCWNCGQWYSYAKQALELHSANPRHKPR